MKFDPNINKSFEAQFEAGWEKQGMKERKAFWKRVIILFLTLFPFSLILGFIFVL